MGGLIVFGEDAVVEFQSTQQNSVVDLVETVCLQVSEFVNSNQLNRLNPQRLSQMNGAELSCGTVMVVEPASNEYRTKRKGNTGGRESQATKNIKEDNDGENLEDFFASLE